VSNHMVSNPCSLLSMITPTLHCRRVFSRDPPNRNPLICDLPNTANRLYIALFNYGLHRTSYMSVCACNNFRFRVNLSKLKEVTMSLGREFQSRIVAGKNDC